MKNKNWVAILRQIIKVICYLVVPPLVLYLFMWFYYKSQAAWIATVLLYLILPFAVAGPVESVRGMIDLVKWYKNGDYDGYGDPGHSIWNWGTSYNFNTSYSDTSYSGTCPKCGGSSTMDNPRYDPSDVGYEGNCGAMEPPTVPCDRCNIQ
jgi:hypothetical protein